MSRSVSYLLELGGVGGIVSLIAFIPWTKFALGSALAVVGAFFPQLNASRNLEKGSAQITAWNMLIKLSGSLRFAVVIAGLLILIGAISDGHEGYLQNDAKLQSMKDSHLEQLLKQLVNDNAKALADANAAPTLSQAKTLTEQLQNRNKDFSKNLDLLLKNGRVDFHR
jgi:hypothetical protein